MGIRPTSTHSIQKKKKKKKKELVKRCAFSFVAAELIRGDQLVNKDVFLQQQEKKPFFLEHNGLFHRIELGWRLPAAEAEQRQR